MAIAQRDEDVYLFMPRDIQYPLYRPFIKPPYPAGAQAQFLSLEDKMLPGYPDIYEAVPCAAQYSADSSQKLALLGDEGNYNRRLLAEGTYWIDATEGSMAQLIL